MSSNNDNNTRPITRASVAQQGGRDTVIEADASLSSTPERAQNSFTPEGARNTSTPERARKLSETAMEVEDGSGLITLEGAEQSESPIVDNPPSSIGDSDYSESSIRSNSPTTSYSNRYSKSLKSLEAEALARRLREGSEQQLMEYVEREFRNHLHYFNESNQSEKDINNIIPALMKLKIFMRSHAEYGRSKRLDSIFVEINDDRVPFNRDISSLISTSFFFLSPIRRRFSTPNI